MPWLLSGVLFLSPPLCAKPHVVLIVLDGVRWQEVAHGLDQTLVDHPEWSGSALSPDQLQRRFGGANPEQRRQRLMPVLWRQMIPHGQLLGDRDLHSSLTMDNDYWFSYPGYNEMLTGSADPSIGANDFGANPNVTVWEWLKPAVDNDVGVYATWDKFHDIFNERRSGLAVLAGQTLDAERPPNSSADANALSDEAFSVTDAEVMGRLIRDLSHHRPQLLFVGFGESDNWAHAKRYDEVLAHLHAADRYIETLWEIYQSDPETRDQTTFIITTDHGRGSAATTWTEHWRGIEGSNEGWLVWRGPMIPSVGDTPHPAIHLSQVASTVAQCFHINWRATHPTAALALSEFPFSETESVRGVGSP